MEQIERIRKPKSALSFARKSMVVTQGELRDMIRKKAEQEGTFIPCSATVIGRYENHPGRAPIAYVQALYELTTDAGKAEIERFIDGIFFSGE